LVILAAFRCDFAAVLACFYREDAIINWDKKWFDGDNKSGPRWRFE
jgi:hypothetical protein